MKVLVVVDDAAVRDAVAVGLQLHWPDGTVIAATNGEEGLNAFYEHEPDVVLLDVTMPRQNGFEVLQAIRRVSAVPVVMLTALGEESDQVRGLGLGADDYVVKPFSHLALLARIRAVLRRAELPQPTTALPDFRAGDLVIDFQRHRVLLADAPVALTPIEYKLLYHLVRNAGRLMPHQALLDRVWGADYDATEDYLKVYVSRLRSKLERSGGLNYIETERGLGYRFVRPQRAD